MSEFVDFVQEPYVQLTGQLLEAGDGGRGPGAHLSEVGV